TNTFWLPFSAILPLPIERYTIGTHKVYRSKHQKQKRASPLYAACALGIRYQGEVGYLCRSPLCFLRALSIAAMTPMPIPNRMRRLRKILIFWIVNVLFIC